MCHGQTLTPYLDLGMQPHSDGFVKEENLLKQEHFFPLVVAHCADCGFSQLTYVVSPEYLYGEDYVYESSITETFRKHFFAMAAEIVDAYAIPADSLAVDIGSNVGLLLSGFAAKGMRIVGVDPAPTIAAIANKNGIKTIPTFFDRTTAENITKEHGRAAVITATNVFSHIDDLDAFMQAIDLLMDEHGMFVIEAHYFLDVLQKMEYDTVYHQHLSYPCVRPYTGFFARFGMEIFDVKRTPSHGGSIRVFVARKGARDVKPIVREMIAEEEKAGAFDLSVLKKYAEKVSAHRIALTELLVKLKDQGKTIVGIGAPAKGNTLLNFCSINKSLFAFVTEKSTLKRGLYTPGTHLPILGDEKLLATQPDYGFILAWNFAPEIMRNLAEFQKRGGKFIIPIPSPQIV
ncbi:class I SAM-dependent methyltransferase [Candidatus Peregrinibacteria bacterium]|nr:class I SAM-dependent methyltransferase [Candidatus Peregrinibacteria bacterium]